MDTIAANANFRASASTKKRKLTTRITHPEIL